MNSTTSYKVLVDNNISHSIIHCKVLVLKVMEVSFMIEQVTVITKLTALEEQFGFVVHQQLTAVGEMDEKIQLAFL